MCQSYTVNGFGFDVNDIANVNFDQKMDFVKELLPEIYEEMQNDCKAEEAIDMSDTAQYIDFCTEWIDSFKDEDGYNQGFGCLVAKAINENEDDFEVSYHYGENDEEIIIHENCQPWQMTERERNMTQETMENIFKKYLSKLNIKECYFGYLSAEYFG